MAAVFLYIGADPGRLAALSAGGDYALDSYSVGAGGGAQLAGGAYVSKGLAGQPLIPQNLGVKDGGDYSSRSGFYNPPHFTYQGSLTSVIAVPGTNATLTLPAGSVAKDSFDIVLNKDVLNSPLLSEPGEVQMANSRIVINEGEWSTPKTENLAETLIFDEQAHWTKSFSNTALLSMTYRDDNGDGIIDGTNPPVRAETAMIWTLDRSRDMWVKMPALSVNREAKTITVPMNSPGVYAIIGTLDQTVSSAYAFPVPFRPNGGRAGIGAGLTGSASAGITFANLPQQGDIEIYTLDGLLVRKIAIPANLVPAQLQWDVKNSAGERVLSDTYIWRIVSGSNVKSGKLMVIW